MSADAPPALPPLTLTVPRETSLKSGQTVLAAPAHAPLLTRGRPPLLGAGTLLTAGAAALKVLGSAWVPPDEADAPMLPALRMEVLADADLAAGPLTLAAAKPGLSLAWIVLSDKGSRGEREDKCGPVILELCRAGMEICHAQGFVIPDDPPALKALLVRLALTDRFDCILTSGGTGVAPRDTAPETTEAVLDKRLPGFERAMTNSSLAVTPHGAISRAVAGTLGPALVINMPGSPKAVKENLAAILPAIPHAVSKLQGDPSDCATT